LPHQESDFAFFVYGTGEACVYPDHAAMAGLTRAAVFLARLGQWERVPGGELLADQDPWIIERLFFPHCKMEPPWGEFAFAVDVSSVYERKRQALAAYQSIFCPKDDRLLALYEAEDHYYGRMLGVAYAEIYRSAAPLLVDTPAVCARLTGKRCLVQLIMPPAMLLTRVNPARCKISTALILRFPLRQTAMISFDESSSCARLARIPSGISFAPGIYPSCHSCDSRTSTITAPAFCFAFASSADTSSIEGLLNKR
jgi:hypothetical protein